ncbi:MAG: DNA polymerase III subunit beta [Sphingomonas sp.]|uniref:DNA polymerase III subunit beta n=1 Tax=Sphingomonas sp. TaxID=28214 RepID=UPI0026229470|nr:DNA polymerase III subunit beta [Sphingomonas sp.]MDK2769953.1 DNA polymerase III subunit beta [Sphingomonas sp.]
MDFVTVEGRTLKHALRPIVDVIERRDTIPILGYLRLSLSGSTLKIEGTDLDITVITWIDVIDGKGEWTICLDSRTLDGIAGVAGVMPVRIERPAEDKAGENANIILGDGDASYELPTLPVSDFPDILSSGFDSAIDKFTNGQLAACLNKVDWCISTEETRYYLNGVFWEIGSSGRRFVATDGHRLSTCCYSPDPGNNPGYIIPRKTVAILTKHLAGKDVEVFGDLGKPTALEFRGGGFVIRSKMIDGTYPDWRRVVPKTSEFTFAMKRVELIDAINRSAVISSKERGRAIRFHNHEGRIAIERKSPDYGTAKVKTSAAWPTVDKRAAPDFGFNGGYFLDIARNCEGDLSVEMTDAGSPFKIKDADPTMTRIIMPMRV